MGSKRMVLRSWQGRILGERRIGLEPHRIEALLAWRVFQALETLSRLLFERYEREFQDFDGTEEEALRGGDFAPVSKVAQTPGETSLEAPSSPLSSLPSGRSEE
jgi:hypothetical protein